MSRWPPTIGMPPRVWLGVRYTKAPAWPPMYKRKLSLARSWAVASVAATVARRANIVMLRQSRLIAPVSLECAARAVELRRGRWKSRGLLEAPRCELTCFQIRLWEQWGRTVRPRCHGELARRGPAGQIRPRRPPTLRNAVSACSRSWRVWAAEIWQRTRACPCGTVSYTHLRAHETPEHLVCRLLLE